jgi:MinD-like ATPase involved in chromosome partitioning or flagellar assembly
LRSYTAMTMAGEGQEGHRVIAVLAGKGGVGCTFVALNLAALSAAHDRLTVLVDGMPERHQLGDALGLDAPAETMVFAQRGAMLRSMLPGPAGMHVLGSVAVTPALLREHLRVLFDVVIVDAGSGSGLDIAGAADQVVLVSATSRQSLSEAARRIERLEAVGVQVTCVLNRCEADTVVESAAARTMLRHTVAAHLPYDPVLVTGSLHSAAPLVLQHPDSHMARRLTGLAAALQLVSAGPPDDEPAIPAPAVVHAVGRTSRLRRLGLGRRP